MILGNIEKKEKYIAGDFNSRTGEQRDFVPEMHIERYLEVPINNLNAISLLQRKNNDKVVNEYGRKLLALCKETDISIVNGRLEDGPQYEGFRCIKSISPSCYFFFFMFEV